MIVLGIDPGSIVTGYGIVQSNSSGHFRALEYGCLKLGGKKDITLRLKKIYDKIKELIEKADPDFVAFEDVFYSRNVKSILQLGQARGAALMAAINCNKEIFSYPPREVKQSLAGYGAASKEQVQKMVKTMLGIGAEDIPFDASDALAIAMCHINRTWTKWQLEGRST